MTPIITVLGHFVAENITPTSQLLVKASLLEHKIKHN